MVNKTPNQDIENKAKYDKSSEEVVEVVKEMESIIRNNKGSILWLAYQQGQIFEKSKLNEKFIKMVNLFGISKFTIKISIAKFLNKDPRMKKSSLFLHLLKNYFEIIRRVCHENNNELK